MELVGVLARTSPIFIIAANASAFAALPRHNSPPAPVFAPGAIQIDQHEASPRCCSDPGTGPELHLPNAAAQTRIVSVAGIRLDSGNLHELSKGYFATTFLSSSPTWPATQYGLY